MNSELDALKARAIEKGLRVDDDAPPPTQEELEAYIREVEKTYLTEEEQELALQAQADLAKGERLARERALATIKAQKKAWKGIYNRTHFIIWAKQALRREQIRQEAEIAAAEAERDSG
jgi:hypothetical protein